MGWKRWICTTTYSPRESLNFIILNGGKQTRIRYEGLERPTHDTRMLGFWRGNVSESDVAQLFGLK